MFFINAVLSFSFLQSKEKERTAKKEKEKHADVFYALTSFGRVFLFASQNLLCSLLSLRNTLAFIPYEHNEANNQSR